MYMRDAYSLNAEERQAICPRRAEGQSIKAPGVVDEFSTCCLVRGIKKKKKTGLEGMRRQKS